MPRVKWDKLRSTPQPKRGSHNGRLILKYVDYLGTPIPGKKAKGMALWVDEMTADFSLSGSTAQSAAKRDFYPRNFNQPAYNFHGQTFNERHYGKLGEFIREAQIECVFRSALMEIFLPAAGATHVWTGPDGKERKREIKRNQRGRRPAIRLEGYVNSIRRTHQMGVQAPEYDFAFIVTRTLAGPIIDHKVKPNLLPTNWDSFINRDATGFIREPGEVLSGDGTDKKQTPPTRAPSTNDRTSNIPNVASDNVFEDIENDNFFDFGF